MPLDGHSYLISQGWSGHGTGLRQDSIIRPLAIPQKRTLSGLGKDRDEAFPFWDHLFSVAAKTIQVKLSKDDDGSSSDESDSPPLTNTQLLDRTSTGILSNKAPKSGTPASTSASGSATPTLATTSIPPFSSSSLLALAKREAAKRTLYSRFFRGPIVGPDSTSDLTIPGTDSDSGAGFVFSAKKRKIEDAFESLVTPALKNGGRTPMAIAKAKLVDAKDAAIHVTLENSKSKVQDIKWNRDKEGDSHDVIEESNGRKKEREESKEERNARREKEKAEKKERKKKERIKKEEKRPDEKQVGLEEAGEPEKTKSRKRKRSDGTSSTAASVVDKTITEIDDDCLQPQGKKQKTKGRKEKEETKDKNRRKGQQTDKGEDEERKRRKRERKEAKKAALAATTSPKPDADVDVTNVLPSDLDSTTPATPKLRVLESKKMKKKRRSAVE